MRKECDFSEGGRGRFFRRDAEISLPFYLDADNLSFVTKLAERKKLDIFQVVNDLIHADRRIAQVMK